jgi:hypothetical protein
LRKALTKRTKTELIDVLMEIAAEDRGIIRRLAARFELEAPPQELVVARRQAIADATHFDERDINRNFHYDLRSLRGGKAELDPLDPARAAATGHGTVPGVNAGRKPPSRDERRRNDD